MRTSYNLPADIPGPWLRRLAFTDDGCWIWTGAGTRTAGGYGQAKVRGKNALLHRWMYERLIGPVPEGLQLDHLCRTKRCCNPAHLEPVTNRVNSLRGNNLCARRARQTHCYRGHPLWGDNLYVIRATGSRQCRACVRERRSA